MTLDSSFSPSILIVGCGGIGGVLAIRLLEKGAQVSIATTNAGVREVWTSTGPLLNGKQQGVRLPSSRVFEQPCDAAQTFDLVFVAVQPTQIEEVAGKLDARLKRQGRVVCLLNGLCEDRLAEHLGGRAHHRRRRHLGGTDAPAGPLPSHLIRRISRRHPSWTHGPTTPLRHSIAGRRRSRSKN